MTEIWGKGSNHTAGRWQNCFYVTTLNCSSWDDGISLSDSQQSKWHSNELSIGLAYDINPGPAHSHRCWFKKIWIFLFESKQCNFPLSQWKCREQEGNGLLLLWIYWPKSAEWQFWVPQFEEDIGKLCPEWGTQMENDMEILSLRCNQKNWHVT